jgi:hypothetical protein
MVTEPSFATVPGFCLLQAAANAAPAVIVRKLRRDSAVRTPRA